MPIAMTEKQQIIQQLLAIKTKAHQAEFKLLIKGKPQEASELKTHGKELSRKIDNLIAQTMTQWNTEAELIIKDMKTSNKKIQRAINDIQNDVNIAKNVVKIVGFIDDVVEIVSGIT